MSTRRKTTATIILLAVLAVGGIIVWQVTHRSSSQQTGRVLYHCPMHPTFTADRPGACPICNMSLVKVEEASAAAAAHGTYTDATQPDQRGQAPDGARPPSATGGTVDAKSVCYQHECPMVHDGKPCPMLVLAAPGESVECPACGTHVADASGVPQKVLYWTDPMLPGYRSDKPGKSPMGMDLVPVLEEAKGPVPAHAETPSGYAPVLLTPAKQQLIGVKTAEVVRQVLTKTIRTVGRVAYDPGLYQAEEEYLQSVKALRRSEVAGAGTETVDQARRLVDASRTRLRLLGLSDQLVDEMAEWQGPDKALLLSDPGRYVWVYVSVYEYELPLVMVGDTVVVESASAPGRRWQGTTRAIDSVLDSATRSARVRVQLEDPEGLLRPEMYVDASIAVTLGEVLAVPEEAVFQTGTRAIVFVDKGQGLFEPRDVTVGAKADQFYEIRGGVTEGERVVTSGNFLIDSESRLKGVLQGMGGGHQHGQ